MRNKNTRKIKMKTAKDIEQSKLDIFFTIYPQFELVDDAVSCSASELKKKTWETFEDVFEEVYTQAQEDIKKEASEDFIKWWNDDKDVPEILGRASQAISGTVNMAQRCSVLSEFWAKESWQAGRLSSVKELQDLKIKYIDENSARANDHYDYKKILKDKDLEIENLKKKLDLSNPLYSRRQLEEKYQEAVKDIELAIDELNNSHYEDCDYEDEWNESECSCGRYQQTFLIRIKYSLNKKGQ